MREKSFQRKLMEVAIAKRIERKFEKEEILGYYMNRIYFGAGLYGIERASEGFFMKPASELTLGEGAMLAGIIRGPSLLNPFRSLENAKDTRDEVLARMVAEGTITGAEADAARAETIALRPPDKRLATGSYVLETVFDLLESRLQDPEDIKLGGFRIYTTIDSDLQASAEKALDEHLTEIENRPGFAHPPRRSHEAGKATRYLQGSVTTLDNSSGAIRAIVGGRSFKDSTFNRSYQAKRQAGSTFKPFVYAVAMDRGGMLPGVYVSDDPIRIETGGGPVWSPKNSDGAFTGLQPAAIGLIQSRNTMSIRVGQIAGLGNVRSLAAALKFGEIPNSPVVFLGAFETNPLTMTSAFSTLAAGGINYSPYLIRKIERRDGEVFDEHEVNGVNIFPESVSFVTSDILSKVMDEGTGRGARNAGYKAPAYGKTGTTNDYVDAWFVGYTDKLTTGVWVGLDQPKTIMNKGYGSTLALPIWTEVMKTAETCGFPGEKIAPPPGTVDTVLCRECGLLQGRKTRNPYQMPLPPDLRPRGTCRGHGLGGLFTNRNDNQQPQAFPLPGQPGFAPVPMQPRVEREEGDVGRALRGIGRFLFGGDPRRAP
jgi:penicillin-binding protein 1A